MNTIASWLQPYVLRDDNHRAINGIEGVSYPYVLINQPPADMAPAFCVGRDEESGVYFISVDVPEEYRYFILAHEMFEFGHCGGARGSCRRALMYELSRIQPEDWLPYLIFRGAQLKQLLSWMTSHPQQYTLRQIADLSFNVQFIGELPSTS